MNFTTIEYAIFSVLLILLSLVFYNLNKKPEIKPNEVQTNSDCGCNKLDTSPFKSCKCPELATWHPGRVEHKLKCKKFWSLNPGRTKKELVTVEGLPNWNV